MRTKLPVLILLLSLLPGLTFPQEKTAEEDLLHRRAVTLARQGSYQQAIAVLEKLLDSQIENKPVLYDYIAVLSWAGKDQQALDNFKKIEKDETIPLYVLSAAAQSARRKQRLERSLVLYRRILDQKPDHRPAHIGTSLVSAEKGEFSKAIKHLRQWEQKHPQNIELLFALAYVFQLKRDFFTEMTYYQKILDTAPGNPHAKRAYIICASTLGAPNTALEMLEKEKDLQLSPRAVEQIKGDRAAQQVKWGELTPISQETRFRETDIALRLLGQLNNDRARFDRLIALRDRVRMEDVVKHYEVLIQKGLTIPAYGLNQAADAYLYLSRPKKAEELYREIVKQIPAGFNAGLSLFYALLESEKYRAAGKQVDTMAQEQPVWFRLKNSRVYGKNSRKLSADMTAIMSRAYSRKLKKAMTQMEAKLTAAPYNRDIRNQVAKIYLWRGWIRKALKHFNLALAQEPDNLEARIWRTHVLIDFHKYDLAAETVERLRRMFPEKKAVQKLARDWDSRHMWHFHSEIIGGRGEGLVIGSRDFSMDNYLYTPPIRHWFKAFLHYHTHSAEFFGESADHQRWGVGIDFSRGDFGGQIEVLGRLPGEPDYGYRIGARWNIDDHWELSSDYTYNGIDIPLKGRVVNLKGNSAAANLVWTPSESTRFKSAVSTVDFNDRNRRYAFFFSGYQRLYTGPKFLLGLEADIYTSSNSLNDRYYFNPESDLSYMASLDAWQTLYRFYDFKFVHRLVAGYGAYRQKHYEPGAMWVLRYEHHWDLNDRKAFLYGISFSRRVYDGNPEKGTTFYATINWRF
jgi:biofilm PGA synthesis protein PgaA